MAAPTPGGSLRPFMVTITVLLIVAALYLAKVVVVPVVLAALLTFLLTPVVSWMQRYRVPRVAAAIVTSLVVFSFLGGILLLMLVQLQGMAKDLTKPENYKRIQGRAAALHQLLSGDEFQQLTNLVDETIQTISPPAAPPGTADVAVVGASTAGLLASPLGQGPLLAASAIASGRAGAAVAVSRPSAAAPASAQANFWGPLMEWTFAPALEIGVDVGVIIVLVIFMLAQHEDLRNRMLRLSGTRNVTSTTKALGEASRRVRSYLTLQFFVNVLFGIVVAGGLWLIGVPYPWLWGVFGRPALRSVHRNVAGGGMPGAAEHRPERRMAQPLETVGLFVLLDLAITNSLEPIIYGRSIGVSGTALLIAAVFWTWMWGPVGLILSTPLTACVVVLGRTVPSLEFLSVVLGDQPPLSPHLTFYQRLLARDEDEASGVVEAYIQKNGVEKSYDHLLVPALAHAKWARDRGGMTSEDEEFILAATGRLLEDVVFPAQDVLDERETAKGGEEMKCRLLLLGCPAKDAMDELALRMLQRLLPAGKCQMEVLSKDALAGEVLTRVGESKPAVVVIGAVPAYSFSAIRYLCKRLRARWPEVRIVVGCWGLREDVKPTMERLVTAGADLASAELLQTRDQLLPLIQEAALKRAARQEQPEAVHV